MRQRGGLTAQDVGVDRHEEEGGFKSFVKKTMPMADLYPKLKPDVQIKTQQGAYLSIVVGALVLLLLFSETYQYLTITQHDEISIDTQVNQRLAINVNITFWGLDCSKVDLVAMDVAGEHQLHVDHDMHKIRLAENTFEPVGDKIAVTINPLPADYCGSCYGAGKEGDCCNTCEELKQAYSEKGWSSSAIDGEKSEQCKRVRWQFVFDTCKVGPLVVSCVHRACHLQVLDNPGLAAHAGEGCNLHGVLRVNKVAGNFHVALGTTKSVDGRLIHAFERADLLHFNTSHTIHHLSFGESFDQQVNPLSETYRILDPDVGPSAVYQYYIKLVPFSYGKYGSEGDPVCGCCCAHVAKLFLVVPCSAHDLPCVVLQLLSYQYSFTEKFVAIKNDYALTALPGVFFIYDYSPFMVERKDQSRSFLGYLTRVFAIVGGMYKLSGLLDAALFRYSAFRRRQSAAGTGDK